MKIGVYGGTFNPPHLGHAAAARAVFELLKLDLLLLVPDGQPPHKTLPAGSPTQSSGWRWTRLAGEQLAWATRSGCWIWSCGGPAGATPPRRSQSSGSSIRRTSCGC